jgi:hypothetical protein
MLAHVVRSSLVGMLQTAHRRRSWPYLLHSSVRQRAKASLPAIENQIRENIGWKAGRTMCVRWVDVRDLRTARASQGRNRAALIPLIGYVSQTRRCSSPSSPSSSSSIQQTHRHLAHSSFHASVLFSKGIDIISKHSERKQIAQEASLIDVLKHTMPLII